MVFSTGGSSLGRTLLCEGLDGHKMGPGWLKPEEVLGLGGRQEPGGALRWGKTLEWGRAGVVMKPWVEVQSGEHSLEQIKGHHDCWDIPKEQDRRSFLQPAASR